MPLDRRFEKMRTLVREVFAARQKNSQKKISRVTVGWPYYDEKEILSALDALLRVRISQGKKVRLFEKNFARYLHRPFAVAANSGTSANTLALSALIEVGRIRPGAEVIVPAATFSSVAAPIIQLGLTPVYVDVDPRSWNIDPDEIEKAIGPKTRVLMPVHTFGNPADMRRILAIARRRRLLVLEDCCEAHGSRIGNKMVGSFGDLATLSFFVAHNITTGEGGMVFSSQKKYHDVLVSLREFGRLPPEALHKKRMVYDARLGWYDARNLYARIGYNVRMTDIAASLGIEQLKKLDRLNRARLRIVAEYQRHLSRYRTFLRLPEVRPGTFHSFYGYGMIIEKGAPFTRRKLTDFLESRGIETRSFFGGCLPDQPAFRRAPKRVVGRLPVSRWIRDNGFFIGCHPALSSAHVQRVLTAFDVFFSRFPENDTF